MKVSSSAGAFSAGLSSHEGIQTAQHSAGKKTHICFGDVEPISRLQPVLKGGRGGITARVGANVLAVFWRNATASFFSPFVPGNRKISALDFYFNPSFHPSASTLPDPVSFPGSDVECIGKNKKQKGFCQIFPVVSKSQDQKRKD